MCSGLKKFIPIDIGIRKIKYKDDNYNDLNDDILFDFQKKYKKKELTENEKVKIEKFMEEKNKNECHSFLLSLKFLMYNILSKSDLKDNDDIYSDVIKTMENNNLDQNQEEHELIKLFFYKEEGGKVEDDDDFFELANNNTSIENYTIDKLYNIFLKSKEIYDKKT